MVWQTFPSRQFVCLRTSWASWKIIWENFPFESEKAPVGDRRTDPGKERHGWPSSLIKIGTSGSPRAEFPWLGPKHLRILSTESMQGWQENASTSLARPSRGDYLRALKSRRRHSSARSQRLTGWETLELVCKGEDRHR
jgi:hypothetical protein